MILTPKQIWDRQGVDVATDSYTHAIVLHRFLQNQTEEAITAEKAILLKDITHLDVADSIIGLLETRTHTPVITGETDNSYITSGSVNGHDVIVFITQGSHSRNAVQSVYDDEDVAVGIKVNRIKVEVTGHRNAIKKIMAHLTATFSEAKVSAIKWWYKSDHGPQAQEIFLEPIVTTLKREYYPWLKDDPDQYIQRYLKSSQSILLMAGPPGTGKTTFLRHMLIDHSLGAEIIYDEGLMNNDSIFQNFLFGTSNVMIIEDADHILSSRDESKNSLMARFLSVSEGIINLPNKKMVFTTNIDDFGRVDSALIRPGRCFDRIQTRELTYQETQIAAATAGVPVPEAVRDYTLAEIFHQGSGSNVRKTGF